jgi:hypothetical protein
MWKWDSLNYKKDINKLGFQMWLKPILLAISVPALKGRSIKYIDDSFHRPDVYCLSRLPAAGNAVNLRNWKGNLKRVENVVFVTI